ncbi:uncharacterized protein A4U43_C01F14060 [Asparagus officinalis]|uniref:RRM domain-containing protein n=1 Tax=Asparagus officinalis TaxID=4686 RepID=A0A5P1FRQ5_ASPOF|nr:uncharacterized protein A4U43_C01F14060 [Asparagus officinalis]
MKPWPSPINHLPSSFSDRFSKGGGKIQSSGMWKIYVGNLSSRIRERELAEAFNSFGLVRSVWVARNPPGYAFIEFNSRREADNAISALDGGVQALFLIKNHLCLISMIFRLSFF